jgi:hypothetical protein
MLSSRLFTPVSRPPIEKLGLSERGLPVQTVPMTAKMVARSTPMPNTTFDCVRLFHALHTL